jgi:hypothetical protein
MIFYVSWNHQYDKIDLGKTEFECPKCTGNQLYTVRLNIDKTKLYGIATIDKQRFVTCICHACLNEYEATKDYQTEILEKYDEALAAEKALKDGGQTRAGRLKSWLKEDVRSAKVSDNS